MLYRKVIPVMLRVVANGICCQESVFQFLLLKPAAPDPNHTTSARIAPALWLQCSGAMYNFTLSMLSRVSLFWNKNIGEDEAAGKNVKLKMLSKKCI